jgi:hypothetical protein
MEFFSRSYSKLRVKEDAAAVSIHNVVSFMFFH